MCEGSLCCIRLLRWHVADMLRNQVPEKQKKHHEHLHEHFCLNSSTCTQIQGYRGSLSACSKTPVSRACRKSTPDTVALTKMIALNDDHNICVATSTLVAVTIDQNSGPVYRFGSLLFAWRNHIGAVSQKIMMMMPFICSYRNKKYLCEAVQCDEKGGQHTSK